MPKTTQWQSLRLLGVMSIGHMLNDLYSNVMPQLLPFLVVLLPNFTASRAAVLVSAFTISSSVFQPIFGYLVDGKGKGWLVYTGTLWMSVFLSLTGFVNNYFILVLLSVTAGLGTAAFHPPASAFVHGLNAKRKSIYQSVFVAFGNLGFALSPLLLVPLFQYYGLRASWVLILPGIIASSLLLFAMPRSSYKKANAIPMSSLIATFKRSSKELSVMLSVIFLRSTAYVALLALLPLFFHEKGISNISISRLLTLMLATGALGGIAGGFISDRVGHKPLIIWSLILATPFFWGFLGTQGLTSVILLAAAGACLLASFSVTTVAMQDIIPEHKALAAGLSLGFANGIAAFAAIGLGKLADIWGLPFAIAILSALPAAAGITGLALKSSKSVTAAQGDLAAHAANG